MNISDLLSRAGQAIGQGLSNFGSSLQKNVVQPIGNFLGNVSYNPQALNPARSNQPVYPFRLLQGAIQDPGNALKATAQGILGPEGLQAVDPRIGMGVAEAVKWSPKLAASIAGGFAGLQKLAGEKNEDIARALPLTFLLGGVRTAGPKSLPKNIPQPEVPTPASINKLLNPRSVEAPIKQNLPPAVLPEPKRVGIMDKLFGRSSNVIAKQGPAGQTLARGLEDSRAIKETLAGQWQVQIPTALKLNNKQFSNMIDVVEGKAKAENPNVEIAANEWRALTSSIAKEAEGSEILAGRRENYFPHRYDPSEFQGDKFRKNVEYMVQTGQAPDAESARRILYNARDTVRNRRQGNLEISRMIDLPGYKKDKEAALQYLSEAAERVAQVRTFGKGDEKALALIQQMAEGGYDAKKAKELFDKAVGAKVDSGAFNTISSVLRGYVSTTKLGISSITNLGQSINTATIAGVTKTLASIPDAILNQESKDFAMRAGVIVDQALQNVRAGSGVGGNVIGKITAPGFTQVERFNRTVAALAGRDFAIDMGSQAAGGSKSAIRALEKMGLDANKIIARGGKLTDDEMITAARSVVKRSQFKVDPQDLPGWVDSPGGRLVAQLRTFAYNQTAFVKRELLDEAAKGNLAPLMRWLIIAPAIGIPISKLKDFILTGGENSGDDDLKTTIIKGYMQAGGLGVVTDVTGTFGLVPEVPGTLAPRYYEKTVSDYLMGAAGRNAGPTVGTATQLLNSARRAEEGEPKSLASNLVRQIPIIGSPIANRAFPYPKTTPEQQAFFQARDRALSNLNKEEKDAYELLHPGGEGVSDYDPRKTIINANLRLKYPNVFDAEQSIAIGKAGGDLTKVDPLYLLTKEAARIYLRYQAQNPGSDDKKGLREANPWVTKVAEQRSEYFDKNPIPQDNLSTVDKVLMEASQRAATPPSPSPETQLKLNFYNSLPQGTGARTAFLKANPDIITFFQQAAAHTNKQRMMLGLPATPAFGSTSSPSFKRSSAKRGSRRLSSSFGRKAKLGLARLRKSAGKKTKVTKLTVKAPDIRTIIGADLKGKSRKIKLS